MRKECSYMNTKEILHLPLPRAEEIARLPFTVWESQFPETDGHTALIAFEGRYPAQEDTKARNRFASMTVTVVQGEGLCYSLEGEGKGFYFHSGSLIRIPRMSWYFWHLSGKAIFSNTTFPIWDAKHQDVEPLTEEDKKMLRRVGEFIQF